MTMIRRSLLDRLRWAEWCICEDAELGLRNELGISHASVFAEATVAVRRGAGAEPAAATAGASGGRVPPGLPACLDGGRAGTGRPPGPMLA